MKSLTLVVDDRELRTLRAALLLLHEQITALPEDLAEMMGRHGRPMTEAEIEHLSRRLDGQPTIPTGGFDGQQPPIQTLVEINRSYDPASAMR